MGLILEFHSSFNDFKEFYNDGDVDVYWHILSKNENYSGKLNFPVMMSIFSIINGMNSMILYINILVLIMNTDFYSII